MVYTWSWDGLRLQFWLNLSQPHGHHILRTVQKLRRNTSCLGEAAHPCWKSQKGLPELCRSTLSSRISSPMRCELNGPAFQTGIMNPRAKVIAKKVRTQKAIGCSVSELGPLNPNGQPVAIILMWTGLKPTQFKHTGQYAAEAKTQLGAAGK